MKKHDESSSDLDEKDAVVEYQQFPVDRLPKGLELPDSWEPLASTDGAVSYGRLFMERTGQIVAGRTKGELMSGLMALHPPDLREDGVWTVAVKPGDGYIVSSGFAVTYGAFEWQDTMNEWLWAYGLGLRSHGGYVEGEAYFADLESGCFEDALQRLRWLESFCVRVNRQVESTCRRMWTWLDDRCRPDIAKMLLEPDVLVDPPNIFELMDVRTRDRR